MMKNVIKCLFFLLLCANFAFGQLLEERKRINIYDNHPGFKYYGDIVKKEKKKKRKACPKCPMNRLFL